MFSYIRGKLVQATPIFALIETGGIGYKIFIPTNVYSQLVHSGQEAVLHTSFVVRENSHSLYGFLLIEERDLFEELISISGIGPKTALSAIGHLPIEVMRQAVAKSDVIALSRVPGIGKKTAERLIIEMRDRFTRKSFAPGDFAISVEDSDTYTQCVSDAVNALIHLGYHQSMAQKAIQKTLKTLPEPVDLPSLITHALKHV